MKNKSIGIRTNAETLEKIDDLAKMQGISRNEAIGRAMVQYVGTFWKKEDYKDEIMSEIMKMLGGETMKVKIGECFCLNCKKDIEQGSFCSDKCKNEMVNQPIKV